MKGGEKAHRMGGGGSLVALSAIISSGSDDTSLFLAGARGCRARVCIYTHTRHPQIYRLYLVIVRLSFAPRVLPAERHTLCFFFFIQKIFFILYVILEKTSVNLSTWTLIFRFSVYIFIGIYFYIWSLNLFFVKKNKYINKLGAIVYAFTGYT